MILKGEKYRVGVLSDTHGYVSPQVLAALSGVDLIVHAGDAGTYAVLETLRKLAPLVAVRGNVDRGAWARVLPLTTVVELGPFSAYVLHNLALLDLDPRAAGFDMVISGHTHRRCFEKRNGVCYLNPGSVKADSHGLVSFAVLQISADGVQVLWPGEV